MYDFTVEEQSLKAKMLEKNHFYNLRNRSVKRMLWPVDHKQTKSDLKKENQKIQKELTEKYNFDFSTGKPLHGKYNWKPLGSESPLSSPCLIPEDETSCSTAEVTRVYNVGSTKQTTKTKRTMTDNHQTTTTKQKRRKVCGKPSQKRKTVNSRSNYSLRNSTGQQMN